MTTAMMYLFLLSDKSNLMIQIDSSYRSLLLEALGDMMYKISLQLNEMKGQALTEHRKELTQKQQQLEELQRLISIAER